MTPPTYIVTGIAGFVGSNLAAELVKREPEAHIVGIDDFVSGSFENIVDAFERAGVGPFRGEMIPGSVEIIDFDELLRDKAPAALFHMGAITDTTVADEKLMLEINTESFGPMVAAAVSHGVPLVYASSAATYGTPEQAGERAAFPIDAAGKPNNVYGFSKWLMEQVHHRVSRLHPDAHLVGLRFFNVFGPGEDHKGKMASMPFQLAAQLLQGQQPRLFAPGDQSRDQVSVHDVVDCTIAAAGPNAEPGVYNLGSGRATSFNEVLEAVRGALGISEADLPTDYFQMPPDIRVFYQDFTQADINETTAGLGWAPKLEPSERLADYARYLKARWDAAQPE